MNSAIYLRYILIGMLLTISTILVIIKMFDQAGREIGIHDQGVYRVGHHRTHINGNSIQSGLYFIRLESFGNSPVYESLVLVK